MAYIKKEPIVEFITKGLNNPDQTEAYGYDAIEILAEIEYAPTADVVEVVRCKDCKSCHKYQKWNLSSYLGCLRNGEIYEVEPTHFCSYGEKALKEREKE